MAGKQMNKKMVGVWLNMKTFNDLAALAAHQDLKVSNYAVKLMKRGIKQDEEAYENGELEGSGDGEEFEDNSVDDGVAPAADRDDEDDENME